MVVALRRKSRLLAEFHGDVCGVFLHRPARCLGRKRPREVFSNDRIGKERPATDRVGVARIEHHSLTRAQGKHGCPYVGEGHSIAEHRAESGGQLLVGDGGAEAVTDIHEVEFDGRDHALAAVLDRRGAVSQRKIARGEANEVAVEVVEKVDSDERVREFLTVCANVLNRSGTARTGDAAQRFDPRPAALDSESHQLVPWLARLHAQAHRARRRR